jgi:hypothetical protein
MSSIKPKKKNLFAFFKSDDFQEARRKMCAMYILLTEVNEMHEDIDDLLKGYEGLFIGDLKHAAKEATAALERYSNLYLSNIGGDGLDLCEATATMTKGIDVAMEQSKFFLQEAHKAIRAAVKAGEDKHLDDAKQLAKEAAEDFEICDNESRNEAYKVALKMFDKRKAELCGDMDKAFRVGWDTAINWINRIYLQA